MATNKYGTLLHDLIHDTFITALRFLALSRYLRLFSCGAMCFPRFGLHGKLFKEAHCAVKSVVVLVSLRFR